MKNSTSRISESKSDNLDYNENTSDSDSSGNRWDTNILTEQEGKIVFLGQEDGDECLPEFFDVDVVPKRKEDQCFLCCTSFNMLGKNKREFCNRCGRSICKKCSGNIRRLSVRDKNLYKICDKCDHDIGNKFFQEKLKNDVKHQAELV